MPWKCAASQHTIAVTTHADGLHLLTVDGDFVQIVPDSKQASCVAFYPRNTSILAIGYKDGSVCTWDMFTRVCTSKFNKHTKHASNIRFSLDCRMYISSFDKTASIATLDDQFRIVTSVKLQGHTDLVNDILPLPSLNNKCVTCSQDTTMKVWNCKTGACLRTLNEHTHWVTALALHPNGQYFASGSEDYFVIVWSTETFEVQQQIPLPQLVLSVVFDESDAIYAAVHGHGVMSCYSLSGEVGPVVISGSGGIPGLALGRLSMCS